MKTGKEQEKEIKDLKFENVKLKESLKIAEVEIEKLTRDFKLEKAALSTPNNPTKIVEPIETKNPFDVLAEQNIVKKPHFNKQNKVAKDKSVDKKVTKIDPRNYRETFKDFLEQYRDETLEEPKYLWVAKQLIKNNHNMFHVYMNDIKKFNTNLAGFMKAQYLEPGSRLNLSLETAELIIEVIAEQKLGVLPQGLYFSLIK